MRVSGFTLIECLFTFALLAMVLTFAVVNLQPSYQRRLMRIDHDAIIHLIGSLRLQALVQSHTLHLVIKAHQIEIWDDVKRYQLSMRRHDCRLKFSGMTADLEFKPHLLQNRLASHIDYLCASSEFRLCINRFGHVRDCLA